MVKRAAIEAGGAHVLSFSACDECQYGVLPGAGSSRLSKILACRCEYFRLDFYFLCDPQIGFLKIPLRDSVGAKIVRH